MLVVHNFARGTLDSFGGVSPSWQLQPAANHRLYIAQRAYVHVYVEAVGLELS